MRLFLETCTTWTTSHKWLFYVNCAL